MARGNEVIEQADGTFQSAGGRRVYPFSCPHCKHEAFAAKSFMMLEFGYNHGGAMCSQCGHYLGLTMVPDLDGDRMEAVIIPQYGEPLADEPEAKP